MHLEGIANTQVINAAYTTCVSFPRQLQKLQEKNLNAPWKIRYTRLGLQRSVSSTHV